MHELNSHGIQILSTYNPKGTYIPSTNPFFKCISNKNTKFTKNKTLNINFSCLEIKELTGRKISSSKQNWILL